MSLESVKEDRASKKSRTNEISVHAANYLKNRHPEIFEVVPIRGRYRQNARGHSQRTSTECQTSQSKIALTKSSSEKRHYGSSLGDVLETSIRCPNAARPVSKDDRKNNTVRMCSIAISTVMMLAQKTYDDITMEHVRHAEEYFNGLKQADGYPANVKQLSHLLTSLKKSGKIVSPFDDEKSEEKQPARGQESGTQIDNDII